MIKFTVGQQLSTRSICDHNCIFTAEVVKRTAKFVTILVDGKEKRCGVSEWDGSESIYPYGRYSMAPIMRASR